MPSAVVVKTAAGAWQTPETRPLDEAVWQAWLAKGRDQERRSSLRTNQAVRWGSTVALLIGAAVGVRLAPYEIVARFAITAGAVAIMIQTLRDRQFAFAAAFAILAALFNPVAPVVSFSGDWERALAAAGTIPFIAPLVWGKGNGTRHA